MYVFEYCNRYTLIIFVSEKRLQISKIYIQAKIMMSYVRTCKYMYTSI